MGLDIYCRWKGITETQTQAQHTGFIDAPEAGYLRFNWSGVELVKKTAAAVGIQSPIAALWPGAQWDGYNSVDRAVGDAELELLAASREQFALWLQSGWPGLRGAVEGPEEAEYFVTKVRNTVAFIDFVLANRARRGLHIEFN